MLQKNVCAKGWLLMPARVLPIFLGLFLAIHSPVSAFDTGYHVDLTAAVMREEGFGETPIKAVQVSNWLTDYYAVSPTSKDVVQDELSRLHFDNLYDSQRVGNYWGWLLHNAEVAFVQAAEAEDPETALTLLGLVLHAVQDFYSHSNWVETHSREQGAPFRRETWLADGVPDDVDLFTGVYPPSPSPPPPGFPEHGDYDSGMNKDSLIRPLWAEAHVFAYCASHEILELVRLWTERASPGFWKMLQQFKQAPPDQKRLDDDVVAARRLSMWVKGKGSDGHWKGDESGSVRYMSKFTMGWAPSHASIFVRKIKGERVHELLTSDLYSTEPSPPIPEVSPFDDARRVVVLRTTYVEEIRKGGGRIDSTGKADLYAVVQIGDQQYIDRTLRKKRNYDDPWLTLHFAESDEPEIPVRIAVWDEDPANPFGKDQCDINPAAEEKDLRFRLRFEGDLLSGDVDGCHNSAEVSFEVSGQAPDRHRVLFRGYVATQELRAR
jgi:hypothetical protein